MDDLILTEELTADYIIQQMHNNDFFAAGKMLDLAYEGDKSAEFICKLVEEGYKEPEHEASFTPKKYS